MVSLEATTTPNGVLPPGCEGRLVRRLMSIPVSSTNCSAGDGSFGLHLLADAATTPVVRSITVRRIPPAPPDRQPRAGGVDAPRPMRPQNHAQPARPLPLSKTRIFYSATGFPADQRRSPACMAAVRPIQPLDRPVVRFCPVGRSVAPPPLQQSALRSPHSSAVPVGRASTSTIHPNGLSSSSLHTYASGAVRSYQPNNCLPPYRRHVSSVSGSQSRTSSALKPARRDPFGAEDWTLTCARVRPFCNLRRMPHAVEIRTRPPPSRATTAPPKSDPRSETCARVRAFARKRPLSSNSQPTLQLAGLAVGEPWKSFALPKHVGDIEKPARKRRRKEERAAEADAASQTCARVRPIASTFVCARCRPFNGLRKRPMPFYHLMHPARTAPYRGRRRRAVRVAAADARSNRGRYVVTAEMPLDLQLTRHVQCGDIAPSISLRGSHVHGVGVFADEDIAHGALILEYCGELIRNSLVDKREVLYRSQAFGSYMFALDNDFTVDATKSGNVARFINHSCEPNCAAKVVSHDGAKHIVLFAYCHIDAGEELCYNYKLPYEQEKLPCLCGAPSCRKFLN